MSARSAQMKLGMFYWPGGGQHMAAWRHPDAHPDFDVDVGRIIDLARLAEKGLFDMFFMADTLSFWRGSLEAMSHDAAGAWIEPLTVMSTIAQHTKHLGLVCTSSTTYDQPYLLARRFAGLDLASGGRAVEYSVGESRFFDGFPRRRISMDPITGIAVTLGAGWASGLNLYAAVLMLGARANRYRKDGGMSAHPPSSIPFLALGAWILIVGWFGFNVMSAQKIGRAHV